MAQYPTDAPAFAGAAEALPALPSRSALRRAAAVGAAEAAVLILRGAAVALLVSPGMLAAFLLAG